MHVIQEDTIVAPATAAGSAGLAVVRISGPDALRVAGRLFRGADLGASKSHRAHHGYVLDPDNERIDEVLALVLRAPHGYTGEDTVELSCHGSPQVVDEIVESALVAGARLAEPGEFTRRAFLNGKLDLSQAEAVADLIGAQSRAARRSALEQLRGRLSEKLKNVRLDLLDVLADIEASIDFVEEDVEFFDRSEAGVRGAQARQQITDLLRTAGDGEILRSGVRVSLAGAPNVGKSSLFNRILESPRAIVTPHPGTTRDVVRETVRVGGMAMVLEDTAGLRGQTDDPVEALGIARSRQSHADADVVLNVLDVSRPIDEAEIESLRSLRPGAGIVVLNKIDLVPRAESIQGHALLESLDPGLPRVAASAVTGEGVEALLDVLAKVSRLNRLSLQADALVCINQRHHEVLVRAEQALRAFQADLDAGEPPEILAASLREGVLVLGEVSGEHVTEEVLDRVFARFCIGK